MAVWRLKIFLHNVILKISQGSTDFSETTAYLDKGEIFLCSHSNNDLFTCEKTRAIFTHENKVSHKSSPGISLMFIK